MKFFVSETLDTCGLLCPEPVMMLHNKIRDVEVGGILEVISTDPSSQRDILKFCTFLGHQLLHQEEHKNQKYFYYIKKL